jgi:hypothetical protein
MARNFFFRSGLGIILTRIGTYCVPRLLLARRAVPLLLFTRQKEQTFTSALDEEKVIIHVQKRDREHDARRDRLVQLLVLERDVRDECDDRPLDHGESRHRESALHVRRIFGRLRGEHFGLLVSRHFYYVQRN